MRLTTTISILLAVCFGAYGQIAVVPAPAYVLEKPGKYFLKPDTRIFYPAKAADWQLAAQALRESLAPATGYALELQAYKRLSEEREPYAIYLIRDDSLSGLEAYRLEVSRSQVIIRARSGAGAFYGVQTLRQLFPHLVFYPGDRPVEEWTAKNCVIEDAPRFPYRGLHLDVGRHFFPVSFIKRYIDLMAMHKMNRFHWHLTEDQGWRMEVRKYPALQKLAACRPETLLGHYSDQPHRFDGQAYCGFYSQEEIREVIAYAQSRFVTIVPEIEMPGHSRAALAAFPELSCTGAYQPPATLWGVFDDVYCAGNEATFVFLENVLDEVCALFPGEYVHIGGDECPKTRWKACPKCQQRIRDEGLHDEHELQSYFIRRVGAMLAKRGKKMIGWDEILEGGLADGATVMSWRGTQGGIAAARAGHDVIMCPGSHCYLDHYQSDPDTEPLAIGGYTTLEKSYAYEPVPAELSPEEAAHILGAQGNVWTEYMKTPDYVEYMAYPRAIALAEVNWSAKTRRNWPDFVERLRTHLLRLDMLGVTYSKALYDVQASFSGGKAILQTPDTLCEIHYTLDGTDPTLASPVYREPIMLDASVVLKAATFRQNRRAGKIISLPYRMHKAAGKPYALTDRPEHYTGGETYALTNGITGSARKWSDWVGLAGKDLDPLIDLGSATAFDSVTLHFVNSKGSWIYPPRKITVLGSDDAEHFQVLAQITIRADELTGNTVEQVVLPCPGASFRLLQVKIENYGAIPDGQPGEGNGAWLFVDEILVE